MYKAAHMTRWLACGTLAVALAFILVGCNGDSLAPSPTPTEAELTEPTPTVEPTPTPTAEPTPTPTPEPTLKPIDPNLSILDQFPAIERSCLLLDMEENRLYRIFNQESSATAEEFEAIAGCISRDTVTAMYIGALAEGLSVSGETSACAVGRLEKMDKDLLMLASINSEHETAVYLGLGYDDEALQDLGASISLSVLLCMDKEEWTALSPWGLNVDDVSIDALRCFLNGLGPSGFFEFMEATERSGATLSLEMFSAAENCGIDLESLLSKQARPEPAPTATPQAQPAPTATPEATQVELIEISVTAGRRVPLMTEWIIQDFRGSHPNIMAFVIEGDLFSQGRLMLRSGFGPLSMEEARTAENNGVEFIELPVALQSLAVMVNPDNEFVKCLTVEQIKALWQPDSRIYTWRDLNPNWPDVAIKFVGPRPGMIEFEFFTDAITGQLGASRTDYVYSAEAGPLFQFVNRHPNALGYTWYGLHLDEPLVKLVAVDNGGGCVDPSDDAIRSGDYAPLTRSHTILVNIEAQDNPVVMEFVEFYVTAAYNISHETIRRHVHISVEQFLSNFQKLDEPSKPLPTATPAAVGVVTTAPTPEPTSTLTPTPTTTVVEIAPTAEPDVAAGTPELLWRFEAGGPVNSSPAVVDGLVYSSSEDEHVYALDALTGWVVWGSHIGEQGLSSPTVAEGVVYFSSEDGNVYALDALTGEGLWGSEAGEQGLSSPTVADGLVYVGSNDRHVYGLNSNSGQLVWRQQTGQVWSSPVVVDGVIYIGSVDDHIYALDAANGEPLWRYEAGGMIMSSPAVVNGVVYVGSADHYMYALDAADGELLWRHPTGDQVWSSPAVEDGVVYFGSRDEQFYALDAKTGQVIWQYWAGDPVYSSPAVEDGVVYVGSYDHHVYALDAENGRPVWHYKTGGQVSSSPAVTDGVVYIGSNDGYVYALTPQGSRLK